MPLGAVGGSPGGCREPRARQARTLDAVEIASATTAARGLLVDRRRAGDPDVARARRRRAGLARRPRPLRAGARAGAALGEPAGVVQLLDRHNRDCAAVAAELGVPHLVVPDAVPDSPFEAIPRRAHSALARDGALVARRRGRSSSPRRSARTASSAPADDGAACTCSSGSRPPRDALGGSSPSTCSSATARASTGRRRGRGSATRSTRSRTGLPAHGSSPVPALAVDAIRRAASVSRRVSAASAAGRKSRGGRRSPRRAPAG